jgi:hypothetical protein
MAEVAAAVTFLASRDASFVNATDLKVDGGYGAMSAEGHGESSSFAGGSPTMKLHMYFVPTLSLALLILSFILQGLRRRNRGFIASCIVSFDY